MHTIIVAILLFCVVEARRLGFQNWHVETPSTPARFLHDITRMIKNREDVRCCCEKKAVQNLRCAVIFLEDGSKKKCKHFPTPVWARTRRMQHYTNSGSCMVASEDIQPFLERFGSHANYCEVHVENGLLTSARLGEERSDYCAPGYRSSHPTRCVFSTLGKGSFNPAPKCTLEEEFCRFHDVVGGLPTSARLGEERSDYCALGYQTPHPTRCVVSTLGEGSFNPPPKCTLVEEFCRSEEGVKAAQLGEMVDVNCGPRPRASGTPAQVQCTLPPGTSTTERGVFHPRPGCHSDGFGGEVKKCQKGVHTYLFFTDGGCFRHLEWNGSFRVDGDEIVYKAKLCPFAQNTRLSRLRRSVFVWYRTLAMRCFFYLDRSQTDSDEWFSKYKERQCPSAEDRQLALGIMQRIVAAYKGDQHTMVDLSMDQYVAPFSLTDVGHSCISGDPVKFLWRIPLLQAWLDIGLELRLNDEAEFKADVAKLLTPIELCNTFLQLPIMWEWIGWDDRGLIWEDANVRKITSFYGKILEIGNYRGGTKDECWSNSTHEHTSPASHGRLVLRAMLPTYYRHVYPESKKEVAAYGFYQMSNKHQFDKMREQLTATCRSAAGQSHESFDNLLNVARLQGNEMQSMSVLERDGSTCHDSIPCNYNKCNLCGKDLPCFDPVQRKCLATLEDGTCGLSTVLQYRNNADPDCEGKAARAVSKCSCYKAICWYFNHDLSETLDAMREIDECNDV